MHISTMLHTARAGLCAADKQAKRLPQILGCNDRHAALTRSLWRCTRAAILGAETPQNFRCKKPPTDCAYCPALRQASTFFTAAEGFFCYYKNRPSTKRAHCFNNRRAGWHFLIFRFSRARVCGIITSRNRNEIKDFGCFGEHCIIDGTVHRSG